MASFQFGDVCYSSEVLAASAAASGNAGGVVQIGTSAFVVDVVSVTGSAITYKFQDVSSAAYIVKEASYSPVPCGLLDTADALVMGWGIAAVWLLTAGILFLRRGVPE